MKKYIALAFMLSILFLLAACSEGSADKNKSTSKDASSEQQKEELTFESNERIPENTSVVSVNGNEIKGDQYNSMYTRVKIDLYQNGKDVSDLDVIKEKTISLLIDEELVRQDAVDKGLEVTEEDATTELESIKKAAGEKQFTNLLEQYQMTEEEFRDHLINVLITVKYMGSQLNIEVTDNEIQDYYEKQKEQNEDIGELAELKDKIESELYSQKQSEQLQVKVEELKKDAEIETLI